jgi:putative transposase
MSRLVAAIKRPCSAQVKEALRANRSPLLRRMTIRVRPGRMVFRFWLEGPGYDRNLNTEKTILDSVDYIHLNPVRRGLCKQATDWRWSSARWYASEGRAQDLQLPSIHGVPHELFIR